VPDANNRWGTVVFSNRVSVLHAAGGRLKLAGQTGPIADGMVIQSARFLGGRGFLDTFRRVDPLFSLDLSDPLSPTVVGELRVPGFSSYLQPAGDDHLLAMGVDMPEPDPSGHVDWSKRRMQLSLFNVKDLVHPAEQARQLIGTASGYSEAAHEHHAFNYFAQRGLLAIPFSDWQPSGADKWGSFVSDLKVFRVDLAAGFTPLGSLSLRDLFVQGGDTGWSPYYSAWVRRSVMASDAAGNDFVYAVSDAGVRVANAKALDKPLASVAFPRPPQKPVGTPKER
jgi:hypothetical protein